jgi:hypothetical protein
MSWEGAFDGGWEGGWEGASPETTVILATFADSFDHAVLAVERLPQQFTDKPKAVALLQALVVPCADLEIALLQLLYLRSVDTALGVQLDVIGKLVGQPRNGLVDNDYRRFVRARIAINRSSGTSEEALNIARLVLGDQTAVLDLDLQGIAAFVLRVLAIPISASLASILIGFLRDAKSAGVRAILETADTFSNNLLHFDVDNLDEEVFAGALD